jgi:hypothetical protein
MGRFARKLRRKQRLQNSGIPGTDSSKGIKAIMNKTGQPYYSMNFIEEDDKTYVLFYDSQDKLVAKRESPYQNINEAIRINGENN